MLFSRDGRSVFTLLIITGVLGFLALAAPLLRSAKTQGAGEKSVRSERSVERTYVGDTPVTVKRHGNEAIRVYNDPKFTSLEEIDAYVNKRKEQLRYVASAQEDQDIEVALSPSRKLAAEDFLSIANKHGLSVAELSLDVFVDGKWDRMVWFDKSASLVDLTKDSKTIMKRIIELESSTPGINKIDEGDELPVERTTMAVRYARGKIKGAAALKLQNNPAILLVDPVTDISDSFKGQANEITVAQMPHLYVDKVGKFGDFYATKNRTPRNQKKTDDAGE